MDRAICCEGNATTHGGKVIRVNGSMQLDGRYNARLGDWVSCPEHGENQIAEACAMLDGQPAALEGHRASCGCVLVSLQKTLSLG